MKPDQDFTEEEFKSIRVESHQFHKTYMEVMETYENKKDRLEEQSIELFNILLTSVGVIAGFGFTALGNVKNLPAFFIGEGLLLSIIVYALWILFSYKNSKNKYYIRAGDAWHDFLFPRLDSYKKFLTGQISKKQLFEELRCDDKKVLNSMPKIVEEIINLDECFSRSFVLLIFGSGLLLFSFMKICL